MLCLCLFLGMFPGASVSQVTKPAFNGRIIQEIVLVGNYRTKDFVILRELHSKAGNSLDYKLLRQDRLRLENLNIFSQVKLRPISVQEGVRLYVEVKERISWLPLPVFYWTHEEGWTYGLGMASINFRGRAEQFQGVVAFGGAAGLTLDWFSPWIAGNGIFLKVHAERQRMYYRYDAFRPTISAFGLEIGQVLGEHWKLSIEGRYTVLESDKPGKTVSSNNRDVLPECCGRIVYDTRDLHANPHQGWLNALTISETGQWLGGTTEITSLKIDLRRYHPLWLNHTLAVGIQTTLRAGTIPVYERIHLGGTETVRGWAWDSFRGTNAAIASAEYRLDLTRNRIIYGAGRGGYVDRGLGGAFFVDTGAVWNAGHKVVYEDFHTGFGLGLRVFMPFVQVVRLDYAWNTKGEGRWQVNLYPKF